MAMNRTGVPAPVAAVGELAAHVSRAAQQRVAARWCSIAWFRHAAVLDGEHAPAVA
jgi:hypothetical protein